MRKRKNLIQQLDQKMSIENLPASYFTQQDYEVAQLRIKEFGKALKPHSEKFKNAVQIEQKFTNEIKPILVSLTDMLSNSKIIQESSVTIGSLSQHLVINSGILEIINTLKAKQIKELSGATIRGDLYRAINTTNNGITYSSTLQNSEIVSSDAIELGIEKKTTSNPSAQIVYQKIEVIETKVEIMTTTLSNTNQKLESLQQLQKTFMEKIEHNPFPYFKIKSIDFISTGGIFVVNGEIKVKLPQYTNIEDLCNILFSGHQQIGETWYLDSIQSSWEALIDVDKAKDITWKQILTMVDDINTLFAKETTIKDLILIERPKGFRLNPKYFQTS